MDQAVVLHPDVDEGPEARDVRHQARAQHARLQLLERPDVVPERERYEAWTDVPAGLLQGDHHVGTRERAELGVELVGFAHERRPGPHQIAEGLSVARRQRLERGVAFRVNGAVVERVRAAPDAQKARRLLVALRRDLRDVEEREARGEASVRPAVLDDRSRERRIEPGYPREQRARGRVQVDAHARDGVLDHLLDGALQQRVRDLVVVLAGAERLGLELDELGERVLQPAPDRDRRAQRRLGLGQLGARGLAGGPAAHARLADQHDRRSNVGGPQRGARHELHVAAARAVADRDRLGAVLTREAGDELARGGALLVRGELDDAAGQQAA